VTAARCGTPPDALPEEMPEAVAQTVEEAVAQAARVLAALGLVTAFGHVSARLHADSIAWGR
jgi:hypothetical protein